MGDVVRFPVERTKAQHERNVEIASGIKMFCGESPVVPAEPIDAETIRRGIKALLAREPDVGLERIGPSCDAVLLVAQSHAGLVQNVDASFLSEREVPVVIAEGKGIVLRLTPSRE